MFQSYCYSWIDSTSPEFSLGKKKRHGFGHMAPIGPIVMAYSVILCVNMMVNSG